MSPNINLNDYDLHPVTEANIYPAHILELSEQIFGDDGLLDRYEEVRANTNEQVQEERLREGRIKDSAEIKRRAIAGESIENINLFYEKARRDNALDEGMLQGLGEALQEGYDNLRQALIEEVGAIKPRAKKARAQAEQALQATLAQIDSMFSESFLEYQKVAGIHALIAELEGKGHSRLRHKALNLPQLEIRPLQKAVAELKREAASIFNRTAPLPAYEGTFTAANGIVGKVDLLYSRYLPHHADGVFSLPIKMGDGKTITRVDEVVSVIDAWEAATGRRFRGAAIRA